MGDVAQILGDTQVKGVDFRTQTKAPEGLPASLNPSKAMKMAGMSREVMHLMSGNQDTQSATLPPIVPAFSRDSTAATGESKEVKVKVGNKFISSGKPARQWTWAPFASSSRTDGAMFRHWVRANVEYTDYPYAKFDIHLDPVTYTDEEYATYLTSDSWTKSETDKLMEFARKYELRWPVIHDRWFGHYEAEEGNVPASRHCEDLQQRYYSVAAILSQIRISQEAAAEAQALSAVVLDPNVEDAKEKIESLLLETAAARVLATSNPKNQPLINNVGTGSTNKMFGSAHEHGRREHLDRLWARSKEEEIEEMALRKELKIIEAQLRKLKKTGGHILAASQSAVSVPSRLPSAPSSRGPSRSVSPVPGAKAPANNILDNPDILDRSFASTAPTPMPQNPYLQSGRLAPPATGGSAGLNKTLLTKMDQVLAELKVPNVPLPTKRVCDVYDSVRKDALTLLTLQKMLMQKEGNLQAKRVKLSKMGVGTGRVMDEEALLGITPPPPAPAPAPAAASKTSKASRPSKSKPSASSGRSKSNTGGSKSNSQKNSAGSKSNAGGSKSNTGGSKPKASTPKTKSDDTGKSDSKEATGTKKPKSAAKRKRKSDAKPAPAASAPAGSVPVATAVSSAVAPTPAKPIAAKTSPKQAAKTPSAKPTAAKTSSKPAAKSAATGQVAEQKQPAKKRTRKT